MQKFNYVQGQDRVKNSRVTINENFQSVASNFSGESFPTTNLEVGMRCYRTDVGNTYILKSVDPVSWEEDLPPRLKNPHTIAISGKVTGTATVYNGSGDISIPVTEVTADSCTGNSATASLADNVRLTALNNINAPRHVWFSDDKTETKRSADDRFVYNPVSQTLTVAKVDGKAAFAAHADKAGEAEKANCLVHDGKEMHFHWEEQTGQPPHLWGAVDEENSYTYKPEELRVAHAETAGSADKATKATTADTATKALNIPVNETSGNIWIQT